MHGSAASTDGFFAAPRIALNDRRNGEDQQGFENHVPGAGAGAGVSGHDDFFEQMLSGLPTAWSELGDASAAAQKLFSIGLDGKSLEEAAGTIPSGTEVMHYGGPHYDESSLLAVRLQHHQIGSAGGSSPTGRQMMFQLSQHQHMLLHGVGRSSAGVCGESGLLPLPLTLGSGGGLRDDVDAPFTSPNSTSGEGIYNGNGGSIERSAAAPKQQHFHSQSFGGAPQTAGVGQAMAGSTSASASAGAGTAPPRQRVRARRGQATDPHSIAERLRRERIAERMKALQELVPNANKTDKASMLDEIIDYVKFLQLQVKVLSMSRLGGAAAVAAPLVADINMSSENGALGRSGANLGGMGSKDSSLTATEHQVAKLMEEDMGTAMQYLQGKGLCLMPISLATVLSSPACFPRPPQTSSDADGGHLVHGIVSGIISHPAPQPANPNGAAAGGNGPASPVPVSRC